MGKTNAVLLKQYLAGAKELEWDKYTLEQLKDGLAAKKDAYTRKKTADVRSLEQLRAENESLQSKISGYKKNEYDKIRYKFNLGFDGSGYLVVFFIWAAVTGFLGLLGVNKDLKILMIPLYIAQALIRAFGNIPGMIVHLFVLPALFYLIFLVICELIGKSKHDRQQEERAAQYAAKEQQKEEESKDGWNRKLEENNVRIAELEKEISDTENVILPELDAELSKNGDALAGAADALEKYYAPGILHMKYRGLVPVTTISEYFDTGRCETLTGHEGAYNLYESEYRMNMINAQLNTIQQQLAHISAQNASIQSAIRSMGSTVSSLMDSVDECTRANIASGQAPLLQSAPLQDYYAQSASQAMKHLDYMASVDYYSRHLV